MKLINIIATSCIALIVSSSSSFALNTNMKINNNEYVITKNPEKFDDKNPTTDVPMKGQQLQFNCWAAASEAVLNYYSTSEPVSQGLVADKALGIDSNSGDSCTIFKEGTKYKDPVNAKCKNRGGAKIKAFGYSLNVKTYGIGDVQSLLDYEKTGGSLFKIISSNIKNGQPIVALRKTVLDDKYSTGGHYTVIVGFKADNISDPDLKSENTKLLIADSNVSKTDPADGKSAVDWAQPGVFWVTYKDYIAGKVDKFPGDTQIYRQLYQVLYDIKPQSPSRLP